MSKKQILVVLAIVIIICTSLLLFSLQFRIPVFNRSPAIDSFNPAEENPGVNEGDGLTFSVYASDPDGDALSYSWTLDGGVVSSASSWVYSTSYGEGGQHTVECSVSDGRGGSASASWTVTVHYVRLDASLAEFPRGEWVRDYETDRPAWEARWRWIIYNTGDLGAYNVELSFRYDQTSFYDTSIGEIGVESSVSDWSPTFLSREYAVTYHFTMSATSGNIRDDFTFTLNVPSLPRDMPLDIATLYVTPDDAVVIETVNEILDRKPFWLSTWMVIRDWVGEIEYEYDDVVYGEDDYWQLPYETIKLGQGDCEDQAILLCTMLRAAGIGSQDVYVVGGEGHAWVSFEWFDVFGHEVWITLEPTAEGGILERWFADLTSTFENREVDCKFNDIYFEQY